MILFCHNDFTRYSDVSQIERGIYMLAHMRPFLYQCILTFCLCMQWLQITFLSKRCTNNAYLISASFRDDIACLLNSYKERNGRLALEQQNMSENYQLMLYTSLRVGGLRTENGYNQFIYLALIIGN